MTTESPARIVESSKGRNWPTSRDVPIFGSPFNSMATEELGLLLKGHNFHREQTEAVPNRSGSAPPSMEGSFAAIGNLLAQQDCSLNCSLASLSSALENCESEEQLRSDPAYLAYYCSNVNLNPRLPPPLISRENRRIVRHIGGFSNNWRATSLDDSGNESLHFSRGSLSTHTEEPEYDSSPEQDSDKPIENDSASFPGQRTASASSRLKSLVDWIQEDFPRTPSPVYTHSLSSNRATTEESIDSDVHGISLKVSSMNISEVPESSLVSPDICLDTSSVDVHGSAPISNGASPLTSFPSTDGKLCPQIDEPRVANTSLEESSANSAVVVSDSTRKESRVIASNIEASRNKHDQQPHGGNIPHLYSSTQQAIPYQVHRIQGQVISQGMNHLESALENHFHGHPKFFPAEQPTFHSSTLTPPLYATAAYMTPGHPFYPNFPPSGLFGAQYSMGGYALGSSILPPFVAGYPSHGDLSLQFDSASGTSFNGRIPSASIGEGVPHVGDLQQASKLYGQPGLIFQPSYVDMQYSPQPMDDPFTGLVMHSQLASGGLSPMQVNPFVSPQDSNVATYVGDQKLQSPTGNFNISSPRKLISGSYYGSPNASIITQLPTSPLASPSLPSSPVGRPNLGRRNEMRFSQGSIRNAGVYSGLQGQRSFKGFDDPKKQSFLEELKTSNAQKFELSDITGRIVEFSIDQHGSRFIQQKLEHCSPEDKASVFKEVLPHASKLMTDVFGNYVIQKFFEYGTTEQRKELADQLAGQMLPLSLQMYGCRVIQKALEVTDLDQKTQLVHELDGHVMRCVHDQNGNHVIQKCIECLPTKQIGFIISSFRGQVATLSTHLYGCRVIQRVLEHCSDGLHSQCIVDEIVESTCLLAVDQYGNYVTQHVLERGRAPERSQIINKLSGKIVQMSQHKYASNVVEKCLEYGDSNERELLIEEIIGDSEENDNLFTMMKDQFANYVVQKIIEMSNDRQREILLSRIRVHLHALKKYTYGKHIVARFEQLAGEENEVSEL